MILIFKKKTLFVYLISHFLNLTNCKILITSSSKSYLINKLEKFGIKKECQAFLYLDMSLLKITNLGKISGDYNKNSNKCVEDLYNKINYLKKLNFFFNNINDIKKKLKIVIYQYFDQLFYSQQQIISWLESSVYKDDFIINFSVLKPGAKNIWRKSNLKIFFVLNYSNYFFNLMVKKLILRFSKLLKLLCNKIILKKNYINNQISEKNNLDQSDIIFFPHNGTVTFGNPPKDHFYSKKIDSPFHPSKIIHLEYDERVDIELEKQKMKKYLRVNFINYIKYKPTHIPWISGIKLIIEILLTINLFRIKNLGSNLLFYSIVLNLYISFKRSQNFLRYYKNAKIALIGYETLFPKSIALALDSLNIKTIGATERFLTPYRNDQTFILDTLLSNSKPSSKIIRYSDRFYVNKIFPVGLVRSDHLFDNVIERKHKYKRRVLVLDTHIAEGSGSEKFSLALNWKNDIFFRNEILLLAHSNPTIEFIFRGKNCMWYKNIGHHSVISKVNKLSNVSVDTDYSIDHWKSYHLCTSSDLIIARPTSLAEECVSKGMNVIVYDYGINYKTHISEFFNDNLLREYYCSSFEQLNLMFKLWIKNDTILTKKKKNQIKEEIFSNLTDGNVKDRIQKYLNQIYFHK